MCNFRGRVILLELLGITVQSPSKGKTDLKIQITPFFLYLLPVDCFTAPTLVHAVIPSLFNSTKGSKLSAFVGGAYVNLLA